MGVLGSQVGSAGTDSGDREYRIEQTPVPMSSPHTSTFNSVFTEPHPSSKRKKNADGTGNVAFLAAHPDGSYIGLETYTPWSFGTELGGRGYRTLVIDTSASQTGQEARAAYHLHDLLTEIREGVEYLRDREDVDEIVLIGFSGGAHLMSFYQNVAENGPKVAQREDVLYPYPDELGELPPADGLLILDGHLGYGVTRTIRVGPHIVDNDPGSRRSDVDMYDPANGYDPDGPANYSDEFRSSFFSAQVDRVKRLIDEAESRFGAIEQGEGRYPDDERFEVVETDARLEAEDPTLLTETAEEHTLINPEGREERIIELVEEEISTRGGTDQPYKEPTFQSALTTTVRKYLSTHACRLTDDFEITKSSFEGIEYSSTNANAPGNLRNVSVPLLVLSMTASNLLVHNEEMYLHANSKDKEFWCIEGATHGLFPIDESYGDTVALSFDAMDRWAASRFV